MDSSPETLAYNALVVLGLVGLSGLFSGLTLGLLSLDKVGLEIVMQSGSPQDREYAAKIHPVRANGNLLLCTLLIGNVAVNAILPIFLAELSSGVIGGLVATALIVIFGEIVPQSICSRHGLYVGAHTVWLVKFFIAVTFPVSWPISKVLDYVLGHEVGTQFSRNEMKTLIEYHAKEEIGKLTKDESTILSGALEFNDKRVRDVMTPLTQVESMDVDAKLDYEMLAQLLQSGHSRIPVWEGTKDNIIGLILVKDLALLNPADEIEIRTLLGFYGRAVVKVFDDAPLLQMLNEFKASDCNLCCVQTVNNSGDGDPFYEILGIVTLEDLIEELIGAEIYDETDTDVVTSISGQNVRVRQTTDYKHIASLLNKRSYSKQVNMLSNDQGSAAIAFLSSSVEEFKKISHDVLKKIVFAGSVRVINAEDPIESRTIYKRGSKANFFTLVLSGYLEVRSGDEGFQSRIGPFSTLGRKALTKESYKCDYTACVEEDDAMILTITHSQYTSALKATKVTKHVERQRASSVSGSEEYFGNEGGSSSSSSSSSGGNDDEGESNAEGANESEAEAGEDATREGGEEGQGGAEDEDEEEEEEEEEAHEDEEPVPKEALLASDAGGEGDDQ